MPDEFLAPIAKEMRTRSAQKWGTEEEIHIVGQSPSILEAQKQIKRFSTTDRPVLITGESGTGKELFAKSLFLFGNRSDKPFRCTNCAQYQEGDLLVSELFGHRKGSFTGASKDYEGLFASADGGTAFLDEIGELSPKAQAMLLRTLSEDEIKPVGSTESKQVDVRVVAATNRPLEEMVGNGSFREDLFYRLNHLRVHLPPVRERGDDWRLLVRFFLNRLNRKNRTRKDLTTAAWSVLEDYHWPGNIREIRSILDVGFCLSESHIEPHSFEHALDFERSTEEAKNTTSAPMTESDFSGPAPAPVHDSGVDPTVERCFEEMRHEGKDFWKAVREPYLDRELNRAQVRSIVKRGLEESDGSYKRLLRIFEVEKDDYLKFMDFLRHHKLKPQEKQYT